MLKLWLAALSFESAALLLLGRAPGDGVALAGFLLLHAVASAAGAVAVALLFPPSLRQPRKLLWALMFGLNFFVPVIGILTSVIGAVAGTLFPRLLKPDYFRRVTSPEYTPDRAYAAANLRGDAARARLRNPQLDAGTRVKALMAVAGQPTPATGPLLREMLADPVEDLRLLAYGLLDRREKEISERLIRERSALESITDPVEQRATAARVAQLFWELVYQDLVLAVEGRYGRRAGGVWLLLARIGLRRDALDAAGEALENAEAAGMPRAALVPYLAELRFRQGRYTEIPALMYELGNQPASGALAGVQQYWAV
jgi:polysaccharide biosynthesis protein PelE